MNDYEIARQALEHFDFVKRAFDNKIKDNKELDNLFFNYINGINVETSSYYLKASLLKMARELLNDSQYVFILQLIKELTVLNEYNDIQYNNNELSDLEVAQGLDEWTDESSYYYDEYYSHFPNEQY